MNVHLCPDQDELSRFLAGELPEEQITLVEQHLSDCTACLGAIASLRATDPLLDDIRAAPVVAQVESLSGRLRALFRTGAERNLPTPAPPMIPGYEILETLGQGGVGVVYKARHLALCRVVALKLLRAGAAAGPQELARFKAESEALAGLRHTNIVQVFDVGEWGGQPFFSMEFVEGGTLADRLANDSLSPARAAGLALVLARAVAVAHAAGIVHRDLKPANVLLSPDGPHEATPKITDFGLAKKAGDQGLTQTGYVLGTPAYMAPEQADGRAEVGPAADIYSLGAVLYEMLTGRPPFQAATPMRTLHLAARQEAPPPSRLAKGVPRDLEVICLKCLEKSPARRYGGAAELADDLGRFLAGEPIRARPASLWEQFVKWTRRRPVIASLLLACLVPLVALACVWIERSVTVARERERAEAHRAEALRNYRRVRDTVDRYLAELNEEEEKDEGDIKRHRRYLELAQKQYHDLLEEYPDNPELLAERGRAFVRLGNIERFIGSKEKAVGYFVKAIETLNLLVEEEPEHREFRLELVRVRDKLGWIRRATGRFPEAIALHEAALRDCERLRTRNPEDLEVLALMGGCRRNLAWAMRNAKHPDWERHFVAAVELLDPLFRDHPEQWRAGQSLWQAMRLLGRHYLSRDGPERAEPWVRQVLAVSERLMVLRPRSRTTRMALALSLDDLGSIRAFRGDAKQAESLFLRAQEVMAALVAEVPSAGRSKFQLGWNHYSLGRLYESGQRLPEAVKQYERALEISEQAIQLNPIDVEYFPSHRTILARSLNLLTAMRQTKEVHARLEKARAIYPAKVPAGPLLVDLAVSFAGSASAVRKSTRMSSGDRERLAEEYLALTLALLGQARAKGVFQDEVQRGRLQNEKAFATLRERAEFQAIAREVGHGP